MKYSPTYILGGYTVCYPEWKFRYYSQYNRIYLPRSGTAYYRDAYGTITFEPDYMYILPSFTEYELWHDISDPFVVTWVHAELDMKQHNTYIKIDAEKGMTPYIWDLIVRCFRSSVSGQYDHFTPKDINAEMLEDLIDLLLISCEDRSPYIEPAPSKCNSIIGYIDDNLDKKLTAAGLAAHCGLERCYFSRKFKQEYVIPPSKMIEYRRMNRAAQMLSSGAAVSEVAYAVGYSDYKNFSRAFKRYFGRNPSAYCCESLIMP